MKDSRISIWFLIGLQLAIFGILISGSGIYCYFYPPENTTVLGDLHPAIWWGAIMLVLGTVYIINYRPK